MQNRVLRAIQRPAGVFHFSVFHQFSGGLGPVAVATHPVTGNLYVANYDFAGLGNVILLSNATVCLGPHGGTVGYVTILSPQGDLVDKIQMPAPEITGLAFSRSCSIILLYSRLMLHDAGSSPIAFTLLKRRQTPYFDWNAQAEQKGTEGVIVFVVSLFPDLLLVINPSCVFPGRDPRSARFCSLQAARVSGLGCKHKCANYNTTYWVQAELAV